MENLQEIVKKLRFTIISVCAEAVIEESKETTANNYDYQLNIDLPKSWSINKVDEFQDWARQQTYEILMEHGIDIEVNAQNMTLDIQYLLIWIYKTFPNLSSEYLPNCGFEYTRSNGLDMYEYHSHKLKEIYIDLSDIASKDKEYLLHKYGKKECTEMV